MSDYKKERELKILGELEMKQEVLTEREIEESIKKFKIANDNIDLEKEFQCSICFSFAHEPINCIECDFKTCLKCFDSCKQATNNLNCP